MSHDSLIFLAFTVNYLKRYSKSLSPIPDFLFTFQTCLDPETFSGSVRVQEGGRARRLKAETIYLFSPLRVKKRHLKLDMIQ